MLDDFFIRALIGCTGIAATAGPLGCIVVWRRMAYFGDTMAHSALLGVALAFIANINMTLSVFAVAVLIAGLLLWLQRRNALSSDSLLGILSHSSLAISLLILSFMPWVRQDLSAYLFGDVLSVSKLDLLLIWGGGIFALAILALLWRPLLVATLSVDLAEAEKLKPEQAKIIFMLLLALIIAIAIKIVGILLITALLILPAATARRLTGSPEAMAVMSIFIGMISALIGLYSSLYFNTPSGSSVVTAAFALFLLCLLPLRRMLRRDISKQANK